LGFTCPEAGGKPSLTALLTAVPWLSDVLIVNPLRDRPDYGLIVSILLRSQARLKRPPPTGECHRTYARTFGCGIEIFFLNLRYSIMKEKAASVGERIRAVRYIVLHTLRRNFVLTGSVIEPQENGVRTAIAQIYTYLPRAGRDRRSLPK
jgi:hypothetical protein